ncbi:MAG: hypothetical protein ACYTEQ_01250 [Planctomycetota bacterium]|jgi:hypothetical protein
MRERPPDIPQIQTLYRYEEWIKGEDFGVRLREFRCLWNSETWAEIGYGGLRHSVKLFGRTRFAWPTKGEAFRAFQEAFPRRIGAKIERQQAKLDILQKMAGTPVIEMLKDVPHSPTPNPPQ